MSFESQFDVLGFDLYEELGADPAANCEELKKLYKAKARQLHPDLGRGSDDAMARLNQAKAYLCDSGVTRAAYDRWLAGMGEEAMEAWDPFDEDPPVDADIPEPSHDNHPDWPPNRTEQDRHLIDRSAPITEGIEGVKWGLFAVLYSCWLVPGLVYVWGWGTRSQRYRVAEVTCGLIAFSQLIQAGKAANVTSRMFLVLLAECAVAGGVWLEMHYRQTANSVSEARLL